MSWHFSRELVEAFSEAHFSGGAPFAQSSSTPTPAMFFSPGKTMDAFRRSQSGMMCELLTGDRGEELLMWYLGDFHARILVLPEEQTGKELMENVPGCGAKWHALLARFDRSSHLWRTAQLSLFEDLDVFLETWPRWGMMHDGACFPLPMLAHDTSVRGYGSSRVIGTPIKTQRCRSKDFMKGRMPNPFEQCKTEGGKPRPEWCEHLMLWPVGWTDIAASGMAKFRQWRRRHGEF